MCKKGVHLANGRPSIAMKGASVIMKNTVFVTGSSRGIGLAIAQKFLSLGYRVALNGKSDKAQLDKVLKELDSNTTMGILADMSDYNQATQAFKQIKEHFGTIDILVNNAGAAHFGLFTDMTPLQWDDIMRNNFNTVLNCTHLAAPDMVAAKSGVIINISSVWGNTGASCEAVYAAAKGAVHSFTKSMAQELGPSGVRVCAIACGAIKTRMNDRLSVEEVENFTDKVPLLRFGTPQEVADLTCFLASSEASYLTGQVIGLDGGL